MKCKVHPNFRLILVAEKQTVYKTFPIPLINRLEKHLVRGDMLLTDGQLQLSKELDSWIERFNRNSNEKKYRGYLRYVVSAHLPQKWLKEFHGLHYIYELSSDGRSWNSEYWHDTANDTHHRVLSFQEKELRKLVLREQKRCEKRDSSSRPTVDAYDGVILRDSRVSIRKVFSPGIDQSVLLSTIGPVCEEYFPNLTEENFSIDQFIHKFKSARKTFYKRYFDSRNISEDEITSRYIGIMLSHIEDGIERQEDYLSRVINTYHHDNASA
ncbi:uncharacterized protein [Argopecten irradians]|uniref:uncharacterized protein n=1 Tax=Argopecten irradians TaxID=31199 RepID=UPI003719E3E7